MTITFVTIVCKQDFLEFCIFNLYLIFVYFFFMFNFWLRAMRSLWISSETLKKVSSI